jgi:hypothetical protein
MFPSVHHLFTSFLTRPRPKFKKDGPSLPSPALILAMLSKGYVALFAQPLTRPHITACVAFWLETFERVEQLCPGLNADGTLTVKSAADIMWAENMEFRVIHGDDFTWVYLSENRFVMETSGDPHEENILPLGVVVELPGLIEVINQNDDRRLDELEAKGLI